MWTAYFYILPQHPDLATDLDDMATLPKPFAKTGDHATREDAEKAAQGWTFYHNDNEVFARHVVREE